MRPRHVCRYLQNKAFFFAPPAGARDDEPHPPATPFTCLRTHGAIGPDGADVRDDRCIPGRACFRPEVEA